MPTVDFWLDWQIATSVEHLRVLLPRLAGMVGVRLDESRSVMTGPGWAMFSVVAPAVAETPIGSARAQDVAPGQSQMFLGPGAARDAAALDALNRVAVHLFVELVSSGLLAPPPPLEPPSPPLRSPEA